LRSKHLALLALLAACGSGPDPSTTGGDVASVLVAPIGPFISSTVADGQGRVYLASNEALDVVSFGPGAVVPSTWVAPASQPEIELAFSGSTLWWAANDGTNHSLLFSLPATSFVQNPKPTTTFPGSYGGDVVGLVADATAVYAAVSTPKPSTLGLQLPSPDSWQWPGSPVVDKPFSGDLYRVGTNPPAPAVPMKEPIGAITFLPGFMLHVLAQGAGQVYWVDSTPVGGEVGRVMASAKATWGADAGHRIGGIQSFGGQGVGFVGLAASDTYVAWAAAPQPYPGATGCQIWASAGGAAPKQLVDSSTAPAPFMCNGLAVDQDSAYFAIVDVYVPPAGPGSALLVGTAIARVPLAGGTMQTVSMQSDRWYGPRRVLVDDTFVYAIDPNYVLRFPKTDFGP
jgi:hypothetical protein